MPPEPAGEPGSLSDETYANILAYILLSNGFEAGSDPLPADSASLADLTIPRLPGMELDLDAPVVAAGESQLLKDLPRLTSEQLRDPKPEDWLHWGRTLDGHSYSPLMRINRENVRDLKLAWRVPLRFGSNTPAPLIHQGVMFLHTPPDTVLAMDATDGRVLWRYQRKGIDLPTKKRGVALYGDMVLVPTSDLHVVALNASTGEPIWDHTLDTRAPEDMRRGFHLRSAPLIAGERAILGVTVYAPKGGFILALDVNSGKEVWRFNTIARPGEPGGNSWNGLPLERRKGGSVWHQATYDAELNLIYFGIAPTYDTEPLLIPIKKEGINNDALYTNCTVALDADTGELIWHYQHMANDQWDLDWVFERQIASLSVDGELRKVVMNVGKMGILDALDAATGEYLFSVDSGTQNVITAIDPETGAKTIDPEKVPNSKRGSLICPSAVGARSWPPTAYSPQTKLLYVPITEGCMSISTTGQGGWLLTSGVDLSLVAHPDAGDGMVGRLQAIDLENHELGWTHDQLTPPSTGLLATGGGLLFSGDIDPSLKAFDDETGELLWQAELDNAPSSTLVTYRAGDKQYIAVVVGMTNNHIRDITSAYKRSKTSSGELSQPPTEGRAAVWAFSLE